MPQTVPIALAAWVALTAALFWRRPGRRAALASMIGGLALLPTGSYPAGVFAEPRGQGGLMHALAFPAGVPFNKLTAVGLGCLAGAVVFDWASVRRLRPSWADAPMAVWCLLPVVSASANGLPLSEGLAQARYLTLVWGVPYLLGRVYLGADRPLRDWAAALVLGGLLVLILGLPEYTQPPFLYGLVYGPHPYQLEGAVRAVGYRPLVFMEHGNQLGMWLAVAAASACWLWKTGKAGAWLGLPAWAVAAVTVAACLAAQSLGAVVLMALALAPLALPGPSTGSGPRRATAGALAAVLLVAAAGAVAVVAARGAGGSGLRDEVRGWFAAAGKGSFTWRVGRTEEYLPSVTAAPVVGRATADWFPVRGRTLVNPVNLSLWMMALGTYGAVGLAALAGALMMPVVRVWRRLPPRAWVRGPCPSVALAAVLLAVNDVDALMNCVFLMPVVACAGGLTTWADGVGLPGAGRPV